MKRINIKDENKLNENSVDADNITKHEKDMTNKLKIFEENIKDPLTLDTISFHYGVWKTCVDNIKIHGPVSITPKGFIQKNSYLSIAENEAVILLRLLSEAGISPKGQKALGIDINKKKTTKDDLLN